MSELKDQVAQALEQLGVRPSTEQPAATETPARDSADPAPPTQIDYDRLANAVASKIQVSQQPPPSFREMLSAAPDVSRGSPRKVDALETEGIIDIFRLDSAQRQAYGRERLVQEWTKTRDRANQMAGAPRLPRALRDAKRR